MTDSNAAPWNWEALINLAPPPRNPVRRAVSAVMTIAQHEESPLPGNEEVVVQRWYGTLTLGPREARRELSQQLAPLGLSALLQQGRRTDEALITVIPALPKPADSRLWLAVLLFVLTVFSTVFVGGQSATGFSVADGLIFGGTLLAILLAHELGHFIASRRLGVAVSYPFFIPMPLSIFGTMGAVIQMKEPAPDRGALFTIGVAGPLAGLALAIPLTFIGLSLSQVAPLPESNYFLEGNNLLYGGMKWLIFGRWLPSGGQDVLLHPMAFAGWVTALNLVPAGQLDGGHVLFGLLGRRQGEWASWAVIALLLGLGFVWSGWWMWAALIFFFARHHAPILDELTPLTPTQKAVGLLTLILFALLFTPLPITVVP